MRWVAVVNAAAGSAAVEIADLRATATANGADIEFEPTPSLGEMRTVVRQHVDDGQRAFLAVGGDGTAHHLVNALMKSERSEGGENFRYSLGLIPAGSGSDLARTFALPSDPRQAISRLGSLAPYPLDLGLITTGTGDRQYFVNACNIGVAAGAVRVASKLPRRTGRSKYVTAFWLHLASAPITPITVGVDHHRFEGEAINVVIANGQFFGGGLNVAPRAMMNDGMFDVQVFQGPKRNAFSVMPRVIKGAHLTHPAVRRYVGASVSVRAEAELPIEADGELVGSGAATVEMVPQAIDLYV